MIQKSPTCVFCGKGPTTVEDIFPKWIHRHLGNRPAKMHSVDMKARTHVVFPQLGLTAQAKVTCKPCNNKFVNGFDEAVRLVLKSMFDRKLSLALTTELQAALAGWAFKTAVLVPFVTGGPELAKDIPPNVFTEFRSVGAPPNGRAVIFMAQRDPSIMRTYIDVHSREFKPHKPVTPTPPGGHKGYGITFAIENLVFQTAGVSAPEGRVVALASGFTPFLLRIWPPGDGLSWPPLRPLNDDDLYRFGQRFSAWSHPGGPPHQPPPTPPRRS
jgi:hypothetical protein